MNKIVYILLMFSSFTANAIPVKWDLTSSILNGSFIYDADNGTYSDMYLNAVYVQPDNRSLYELFTVEGAYCCVSFISFHGNGFVAYDGGWDADLYLRFGSSLTNSGGQTTFIADISDYLNQHHYNFTGSVISSTVSEPSSLITLSMALFFLGFVGNKKRIRLRQVF